jgi:amidase
MTAASGPAMSWQEWARHDGMALAELVRTRQVSVQQVTEQAAAAVAKLNPKLEAVIELFDDVRGNPDADGPDRSGKLYGVPIFLKDLGSGLKGRTQDSGSAFTKGTRITATDPTVENFLRAGLVPLGRSTTPEFGMTFDTTTDYRGAVKVTRNPWNLNRTPGGSSGGSAAAVAAGVVPLSMSSDGGGSTRIPASFCGLIGLKASRGRVPQPLARNEYVARISIEGVVSRTVRDSAAAYDYLSRVPNGGSFIRMDPPPGSYLDAIAQEPGRLKIGLSTARWGRDADTDPEVATRVHEVARLLESLGHVVDELNETTICDWEVMWWTYTTQWISSRSLFTMMAQDKGVPISDLPKLLNPMTVRHYQAADRYGKFDIFRMMNGNNTLTRQFGDLMERYDALLTPTLAIRVPEANGPYSLLRDEPLEPWLTRLTDACRYTMPANETGLPAINIPAGLDHEGMPIGAQLYGNFAREDLLLQLAAQLERARPEWFGAIPPIHVTKGD